VELTVSATFELPLEAAEVYEARFVPALFGEWAPDLVTIAGVEPGHRVVDVACGTGVVAREAATRVGHDGHVLGVDRAEAMLTVARRLRPDLEWRRGDATDLPLPDGSVDIALCQASLMFIDEPVAALTEMGRVVRPGGTVAVHVWGRLEASTGLAPFAHAVERHAGPGAVELWATYFRLGDLEALAAMFGAAGLEVTATRTRLGAVRMASVDDYVAVELEGTPLGEAVTDAAYRAIREEAQRDLRPFVTGEGVALPIEGHLVAARKP
jgi:ubiquinone/menaquinone biosynthesis C-methylase UbiE